MPNTFDGVYYTQGMILWTYKLDANKKRVETMRHDCTVFICDAKCKDHTQGKFYQVAGKHNGFVLPRPFSSELAIFRHLIAELMSQVEETTELLAAIRQQAVQRESQDRAINQMGFMPTGGTIRSDGVAYTRGVVKTSHDANIIGKPSIIEIPGEEQGKPFGNTWGEWGATKRGGEICPKCGNLYAMGQRCGYCNF